MSLYEYMEGCIEHIVNVTLLTQRHTKETRVSKHQNVPGMSPFVLLVTGKETDYFKMSTIGSHELCFLPFMFHSSSLLVWCAPGRAEAELNMW